MKSMQKGITTGLFGGVFGVMADSMGQTQQFLPAGSAAPVTGLERSPKPEKVTADGLLTRLGNWIWRRQMTGIAPQLARSQDVFDRLDRWMWRQHTREIEAYLAKSQDVFELERRIRHLERGPDPRFS